MQLFHHSLSLLLHSPARYHTSKCWHRFICHKYLELYYVRRAFIQELVGKRCIPRRHVLYTIKESAHQLSQRHFRSKLNTSVQMRLSIHNGTLVILKQLNHPRETLGRSNKHHIHPRLLYGCNIAKRGEFRSGINSLAHSSLISHHVRNSWNSDNEFQIKLALQALSHNF